MAQPPAHPDPSNASSAQSPSPHRMARAALLILLLALVATGAALATGTHRGRQALRHPHVIGRDARVWVERHPVIAPVAFVAAYCLIALASVPVWWLQVVAGYCFGLLPGIGLSLAAAGLAAGAGALLGRWLAGDWQHSAHGKHLRKLLKVADRLGNNGLLVVIAARVVHIVPFGPSNYLFGLVPISMADVVVGTLLGNLPSITIYTTASAAPHLMEHWRFYAVVIGMHAALLVPLALRYLRPSVMERLHLK